MAFASEVYRGVPTLPSVPKAVISSATWIRVWVREWVMVRESVCGVGVECWYGYHPQHQQASSLSLLKAM